MEIDTITSIIDALKFGEKDIKEASKKEKTGIVLYGFALSDGSYYKSYNLVKQFLGRRYVRHSVCFPISENDYLDFIHSD